MTLIAKAKHQLNKMVIELMEGHMTESGADNFIEVTLEEIEKTLEMIKPGAALPIEEITERYEDMSKHGRLSLMIENDGDIIISVVPDPDERREYAPSVQYCTMGSGGGRSPHTRRALAELIKAMKLDNIENPINRD